MLIDKNSIIQYLIRIFVLMTAFPIHESAHAWMASRLGDDTGRYSGRISLNPMNHLDPIGTILMIFAGVGWAKPVPINPRNFENPKKGMALSALAGPVSNFLLSLISMIILKVILEVDKTDFFVFTKNGQICYSENNIISIIVFILYYMIIINIMLAIFNLIPIPPLDGSRIATAFLKTSTYFKIMQYEKYIMIAVMLLAFLRVFSVPLNFLSRFVFILLDKMTFFVGGTLC